MPISLFLLGGFGCLSNVILSFGLLDDTDCDGLLHVSDSESSKRRVLRENFDNHRFLGDELDHGCVSGLNGFGLVFENLTVSSVDFRYDVLELAGNVSSVAI